jgi:hypothetical protein
MEAGPPYALHLFAYHDALVTTVSASSGVFGVANEVPVVPAAELHPHDQARTEPLATIESIGVVGTLGLYAGFRFVRSIEPSARRLIDGPSTRDPP